MPARKNVGADDPPPDVVVPIPEPPVAQAVASTATMETATGVTTVNQVGISDDMKNFLASSDFKMDWTRRRTAVYATLSGFGTIVAVITGAILALMFMRNGSDFERLLDVVTTLLYTSTGAIMMILGSYVFGAQYDASNFRSSVISIMNATKGRTEQV